MSFKYNEKTHLGSVISSRVTCFSFTPSNVVVDNQGSIALVNNLVFHFRIKHIKLDVHFVREKVLSHQLFIQHVSSFEQKTDIFIKPLPLLCFQHLHNKLHVTSLSHLNGHKISM